jgi:hypothetical protein
MKFAQSQLYALCAVAGLASVQAAPALASDDKSTASALMEMVGVSSNEGASQIDYSERPKLVLPPRLGELPSPRERAERSGDWPAQLSAERRRNADRYARLPNAPPEAPRQGVLARVMSFGSGAQQAPAPAIDEPGRRMLSEPPTGYRRPTKDLSKITDTDAKKSSWWNPLSWGRGSANNAASAAAEEKLRPEEQGVFSSLRKLTGFNSSDSTTIGTSPAQQTSSSDSGSWFQMPSFVRGSDDTR